MPMRSSGRRLLAGGLLVAALAGCGAGDGDDEARQGPRLRAGGILLAYPPEWDRADVPAAFRAVGVRQTVALEPEAVPTGIPEGEAGLVIGRHSLDEASALPDGLEALFAGRASGGAPAAVLGQPVRLEALDAYRFAADDTAAGFAGLAAYAVPTTEGVVDLICYARTRAVRFHLAACERVARGVRLTDGRPLPAEPSPAYADQLRAALDPLNRERASGVAALRAARTPRGQGRLARALATAHRRAVARLESAQPPPTARAAHRAIATGVGAAAAGYTQMADAVRDQGRAAYARGRRAVAAAEAATNDALFSLRSLGYVAQV